MSFCPVAARPALSSGDDLSSTSSALCEEQKQSGPPSQPAGGGGGGGAGGGGTQMLIHGRLRRSYHTKQSPPNLSACLEISLCIYVAV